MALKIESANVSPSKQVFSTECVCVCVCSPLVWELHSGRVGAGDLEEDPHGGHLVVRRIHVRQLYQSDPHTPDVRLHTDIEEEGTYTYSNTTM